MNLSLPDYRRIPSGVLSDAIEYMDGQLTMSKYPEKIRWVIYLNSESGRKFIFFSNALNTSSVKDMEMYHNRWRIKLFFKCLKQHLKIKNSGARPRMPKNPDLHDNNHLLHDGNCTEKDGCQTVNLRDVVTHKRFTYKNHQPQRHFLKTWLQYCQWTQWFEWIYIVLIVKLHNYRPRFLVDTNVSNFLIIVRSFTGRQCYFILKS